MYVTRSGEMSRKSHIEISGLLIDPESTHNSSLAWLALKIWLHQLTEIWSVKLCLFEKMAFDFQKGNL